MFVFEIRHLVLQFCKGGFSLVATLLGNPPLPNPFGDPNISQPIMPIQQNVADILFVRTSYVKKIIEDCSNSEETIKLLRFCCWENPQFSSTVLSDLLWQVKVNIHMPIISLVISLNKKFNYIWPVFRLHIHTPMNFGHIWIYFCRFYW